MAKKFVIVDIDGTIAKINPERMQYAHVDWDAFYADKFDDEPVPEMVSLVKSLMRKYEVVYCTARSERARVKTLNWFDRNEIPYSNDNLLMRGDNDERPSVEVKLDLLKRKRIRHSQIAFIIEDNNKVVKAFRELGILVLQCDNNEV